LRAVIENNRTGAVTVADLPEPALVGSGILVRTEVSVVSAGTERVMIELAQKSLLGKARERPDLVRQVVDKARRDGIATTVDAVMTRLDTPVPLGYSSAGTVIAVSPDVDEFKVGDRVACAGAGYASHAEVVFVPRNLAARVPPEVDAESAAFATLGSVALHGLRLSEVSLGETMVVLGLGVVGLLAIQLAAAAGCRTIGFDPQERRAEIARNTGAELAVSDADALRTCVAQLSGGAGADAVLVAAGTTSSEPVAMAAELARDRGAVVLTGLVGLDIPRRPFYDKELRLRISRSYGPGRYDASYEEKGIDYPIGFVRWTEQRNLQAFVQQVAAGRVRCEPLVTHRFAIADAEKAYELIVGGDEPSLGVLITYPSIEQAPAASDRFGSAATEADRPPRTRQATPEVPEASRSTIEGLVKQASSVLARVSSGGNLTSRSLAIPSELQIGTGVLGAGAFASETLLPALSSTSGLRMVGVCAATGLSSEQARTKFGFAYGTTDEERLLSDPAVDLVVIATRHNLHARQVVTALRSGKNVFVEKPLCLSVAELGEITQALRHEVATRPSRPVLMVGYNRRFAPLLRRLRSYVARSAEPLVATYRVNAGYIPTDHWVQDPEIGGGRLIGEVCHFVDCLIFLTDSIPSRVFSAGLPGGGRYRDDNVSITIEFANGSVGTILYASNGSKSFPKERIEVYSGGLTGVLDNFRRLDLAGARREVIHPRLQQQDKGHVSEIAALAACLTGGSESPIPFTELVATSMTTFAALGSLRSGCPSAISPGETDAP
jgi:predicted dehydrogenase/threonine dehydrogenase-like Zn-dependent dehydrogenase